MAETDPNTAQNAVDAFKLDQQKEEETKTPKERCEEQGGTWDAKTGTCLLMPKEVVDPIAQKQQQAQAVQLQQQQAQQQEQQNQNQVFRNENDKISGISIGGRDFLGLSPKDVEKITSEDQFSRQGGPATQAFEKRIADERAAQLIADQQRAQQIISQNALANLGLNPNQIAAVQSGLVEAPVDVGQAVTAGVANIIPNVVGGAAAGAAIGSVGAGVGAIPGAVIGGVGGLIKGLASGILGNIKKQQSGEISKSVDVLTSARRNMRTLSSLAAKDPSNAAVYVDAYNQQLAQVYQAQRQIKLETTGNLNKFMEDGTDILSDFDLFLQPNGQADIYRRQLELALATGQAPPLTIEDFNDEQK